MNPNKKLYRDTEHKMIAGVCAGLAEYFEMDVTIVRLIAVVVMLCGGSGVLLYLIAALVIPAKPAVHNTRTQPPQDK